jgi:putative ABC transport system permease protein
MRYLPLIWAALWRRKLRTWFTLLSAVVAFFLFGMLEGFNGGLNGLYDLLSTERLRTVGRINNAPLPLAHRQRIEALDGITAVTPVTAVSGATGADNAATVVMGVDARAWFSFIYPQFVLSEAGIAAMERTRNGVVVGRAIANDRGWHLGERISLRSKAQRRDGTSVWDFEIVGIYEIPRRPQWATMVVTNYDYINDSRALGANKAQQYISRIADPDHYAQVSTAVDELFANSADQTVTLTEEDFVRAVLARVGNISYLVNGIVGAVLFTLLFLIVNTMALSVRERIPELAALKTLGFTGPALLSMVLAEVLLLCLTAGGVGLGISAVIFPAMMKALGPQVGLEGMRIPVAVFGVGAAMAVAVAVVSGLPPALRALRLNIVDGLANR